MARRLATPEQRRAALLAEVDGLVRHYAHQADRPRLFEAWRRAHRGVGLEPPRHAAGRFERACEAYARRRVEAGWFFASWRGAGGRVHVALVLDGVLRVRVAFRGRAFEAAV